MTMNREITARFDMSADSQRVMAGLVHAIVLAASVALSGEIPGASEPPEIDRIASNLFYRDPAGPNWAEELNARITHPPPRPPRR